MKTAEAPPELASDWQETPYANLIRYKPSANYFARIRVKGKLIRRSLQTKSLSVVKLRLADFEKSERQRAHSITAVLGLPISKSSRTTQTSNPKQKSITSSATKLCWNRGRICKARMSVKFPVQRANHGA
jgi:hypothetical protein